MADPPVSNDDFALATVATRPDEAGGPPPQVLRATGQPRYETGFDHQKFVKANPGEEKNNRTVWLSGVQPPPF
jgi:hypothetical protein